MQDLNFTLNHPMAQSPNVVRTVHHKALTMITEETDKIQEVKHINTVFKNCGYLNWVLTEGNDLPLPPPPRRKI